MLLKVEKSKFISVNIEEWVKSFSIQLLIDVILIKVENLNKRELNE